MRRILLAFAASLACTPAWADGPIIKWDRFEGAHYQATENGCVGGPLSGVYICPGRPRSSGPGQAVLNLYTGSLSFRVTGIAYAIRIGRGVRGLLALFGGRR